VGSDRQQQSAAAQHVLIDGSPAAAPDADEALRAFARGLGFPLAQLSRDAAGAQLDRALRAARGVVLVARRIDPGALPGQRALELATRARQGGVPAFAVVGEHSLTPFDARVLDLQLVLTASGGASWTAAGESIAAVL